MLVRNYKVNQNKKMTEQSLASNRYQQRLESAQQIADYDDLSDDSKGLIAQLAYDKDLSGLDFNEALNAELVVCRRNIGNTALTHIVERPRPTVEQPHDLPVTFEDARTRSKGLSIEQIAGHRPDFKRAGKRELHPDEKSFFSDGGLLEYERELNDFIAKLERENPHPETRKVRGELQANPYDPKGWRHMNSKEFIRSRKEGSTDDPSSRIYLSPRYGMDMIAIYKEVFERAEQEGLRFKSKVFATEINTAKSEDVKQRALQYWADSSHQVDPILFYPFEESKDALLQIVADVYDKHQDAFRGARTGAIPAKIAPGFAVGDEPHGVSGKESLTTHREKFINRAEELARNHPQWEQASREQKKRIHLAYLRRVADKMNIDPDNIAFDA